VAARDAVGPALENARGPLAAGVESALGELEHRRADLVAATTKATADLRTKSAKTGRDTRRKAARTAARTRRRTGLAPAPRRWPWVVAALVAGTVAFVLLRRKKADPWTPAPAGDGPVPSYREDPVPSSPSNDNAGKTVSSAQWEAGDSAPNESDMGIRDAQLVAGDDAAGETDPTRTAPEPFTSGGGAQDAGPTAGPPGAGQA